MPALAPDAPAIAADENEPSASDSDNASPNFYFHYQDRKFQAWTQEDAGGPTVYLACELGHLPYSAENRDGRRKGLMILSAASTILSARLMLTDFHRVSLLTTAKIADTEDMTSVMAAAAASVIGSLPLIELMEKSVTPAAS